MEFNKKKKAKQMYGRQIGFSGGWSRAMVCASAKIIKIVKSNDVKILYFRCGTLMVSFPILIITVFFIGLFCENSLQTVLKRCLESRFVDSSRKVF
jgi:hypothetical protein